MNIKESLATALRSLRGNKVRSGLTMLGIVIGVAAVIAMLSIGRGSQEAITSRISSMGTNLLFVMPGAASQNGVRQAQGSQQTLTYEDAQAIADPANCPSVAAVAPEVSAFGQVVYGSQNVNTRVTGVTPEYATVRNYEVAEGSFIDESQLAGRSLVAVLGSSIATSLFQGDDPVGQTIRINNVPLQVIGVLAAKGGTGFGSQDDIVLVPLTTVQTRMRRTAVRGGNSVSTISVQAVDERSLDQATEEITALLRDRHHILFDDDFTVSTQEQMLSVASQVTGVMTVFLGGIAAISLLVGGIGIMNIMLVSVSERTREIGIRKAVGAKRGDILGQFLTEAMVLSVAGGLIGVALGWGISRVISGVSVAGGARITPVVGMDSVLLATGFSLLVGIFFGIYPALRAAALRPIEALRYE